MHNGTKSNSFIWNNIFQVRIKNILLFRFLEIVTCLFFRVSGLIKAKAMKYEDRPVWFDVYRAFPPMEDPYFHRKNKHKKAFAKQIIYPEDVVRA